MKSFILLLVGTICFMTHQAINDVEITLVNIGLVFGIMVGFILGGFFLGGQIFN